MYVPVGDKLALKILIECFDKSKGEIENICKHFVPRIIFTLNNDSCSTLLAPEQCPSTAKELVLF